MVQTRQSAKRCIEEEPTTRKSMKPPVVITILKASLAPRSRSQRSVSRSEDSATKKSRNSEYTRIEPIKSAKNLSTKGNLNLKTIKTLSEDKDFIKNKENQPITWKGHAEIKYTNEGFDLKLFKKANWGPETLSSGDIVRLTKNSGSIFGQITYLFEEGNRKQAEVRLIYPFRKQYLETYEYATISLAHIFEKIEFTTENGYTCENLQDKSGKLSTVPPENRLERSLLRSKLSLQLCDNNNSLHHAIALLTLSSIPSNLVGRTQEKEEIIDFLSTSLNLGHSASSLYICGMPGTGKTATFLHCIDFLRSSSDFSNDFKFIHINCMKLSKPQEIYNLICEELFNKNKSGHNALEQINTYIKSQKSSSSCVVLLVDELDALLNKKQDVLYNLFNWTSASNSNFIVAGIANTMDLSDKFIHKVSSRMGNRQIVFAPYSRDQLQEIITKRLRETNAFTSEAILFCAAKIASYSGDVRRAFQVCKKAAFLALEQKEQKIGIEHIQRAFKQLFASVTVQAIQSLPVYLKLLLVSLCLELKNNNKEITVVERLHCRLNSYCDTLLSIKTLSLKQVQVIVSRLASLHLLSLESDCVKLLITPDDIIEGVKAEPLMSSLESFLQGA